MRARGAVKGGVLVGLLGLGLVVGPGVASGSVRASTRAEPTAAARTEGIEVKVEESFTNAETTRSWIEERAARTLEQLEPGIAEGDLIRILVRGGAFDYRISLELWRQGQALAAEHQPSEIACACGSDEMLEVVAKAIEAGARGLDEAAKREREETAERQRREDERQEAERKQQDAQRTAGYRPSRVGRAGIGITSVGGLAVLTGGLIAGQGTQPVEGRSSLERHWSSPGYAVIGTGVAVVTAGVTMLVVDIVRCRRNPMRCGVPATARGIRDEYWASRPNGGLR